VARCRTATRGDLEIERCLEDGVVSYTAHRGRDEVAVGSAEVYGGKYLVTGIQVDAKAQRGGVGTRLYEQFASDACEAGLELASDVLRSHFAEAFWRKQEQKGRVKCAPGQGEVYKGPLASLKRRLADGRITREEFERKTKGLPAGTGPEEGFWPCANYVMARPCEHARLDGVRRTKGAKGAKARR
jgi:GNAT superfamily N-acetyltransferase